MITLYGISNFHAVKRPVTAHRCGLIVGFAKSDEQAILDQLR